MTSIERSVELEVPASVAYDAWTQFELFPRFMEGVESVTQLDDKRLQWRASILGVTEEWEAEITEQIPGKRIAWCAEGDVQNAGVVTFHRLSDERSRVMLQMSYELKSLSERVGDALGVLSRQIEGDLERFKQFVEKLGDGIEGWRGRVTAPGESRQDV